MYQEDVARIEKRGKNIALRKDNGDVVLHLAAVLLAPSMHLCMPGRMTR